MSATPPGPLPYTDTKPQGSADFYFDPLVLRRLTSGGAGTFARLPGSWRDY